MSEQTVVDEPDARRFVLREGDDVAGYLSYEHEGPLLVLAHTVVEPAHEGQGVGSALVRGALEAAREQGAQVLPQCRFVRRYLTRHPEHLDLVPQDRRAEFDLDGQAD